MICSHCQGENTEGKKFCKHCGESLEIQKEDKNICPECHVENILTANFCKGCGTSFLKEAMKATIPNEQLAVNERKFLSQKMPIVTIALVTAVIAVASIGGIILYNKNNLIDYSKLNKTPKSAPEQSEANIADAIAGKPIPKIESTTKTNLNDIYGVYKKNGAIITIQKEKGKDGYSDSAIYIKSAACSYGISMSSSEIKSNRYILEEGLFQGRLSREIVLTFTKEGLKADVEPLFPNISGCQNENDYVVLSGHYNKVAKVSAQQVDASEVLESIPLPKSNYDNNKVKLTDNEYLSIKSISPLYVKADKQLNQAFSKLIKELSVSDRERLKKDQNKWIDKRNKQAYNVGLKGSEAYIQSLIEQSNQREKDLLSVIHQKDPKQADDSYLDDQMQHLKNFSK